MEWVDVSKEMVIDEVPGIENEQILFYSHKFGSVFSIVGGRKVIALSGMKSGNYKVEMEYVDGKEDMTIRVFMREPAENFRKKDR